MSDSDSSSLKTDIVSTPNSEIRNLIGRLKICMYWKAKKQTVSFFFWLFVARLTPRQVEQISPVIDRKIILGAKIPQENEQFDDEETRLEQQILNEGLSKIISFDFIFVFCGFLLEMLRAETIKLELQDEVRTLESDAKARAFARISEIRRRRKKRNKPDSPQDGSVYNDHIDSNQGDMRFFVLRKHFCTKFVGFRHAKRLRRNGTSRITSFRDRLRDYSPAPSSIKFITNINKINKISISLFKIRL